MPAKMSPSVVKRTATPSRSIASNSSAIKDSGRCIPMRLLIKTCLAATLAGILVVPTAHASIILDFFPASTFNPDTSAMDAALGITGFTIDDFSSTTLTPGLTIALSGGVTATTWTTLPNLFNQNVCGTLSTASWAGMYAATNSVTNQ